MREYEIHIESVHRGLGIPEDYRGDYGLALQYEETDLVDVEKDIHGRQQRAARAVLEPWQKMKARAAQEGVVLLLVSAFRSVDRQAEIVQRKIAKGDRMEDILKVCAAPGYSEHHTGRALDLTTNGCQPLAEAFDETEAFVWLRENASAFSFRLSYPLGNKYGIAYEPWHWAFCEE